MGGGNNWRREEKGLQKSKKKFVFGHQRTKKKDRKREAARGGDA